jgi:hypothetical protein
MQSLTVLAIPIYQQLGKQYPNLSERREATRQYLLKEITHWDIKELEQNGSYFFKPIGFERNKNSKLFQVRLVLEDNGFYNLKFGDLNASTDDEKFEWNENDPYKLQKALFLNDVIDKKIIPLLQNNIIKGIQFEPYDEDELGDERVSYFSNMFNKLGKDKFNWVYNKEEDKYFITKK